MFALFAADIAALTVVATAAGLAAVPLEGVDIAVVRIGTIVPIIIGVLFGASRANRYAWYATATEQIGSLIRYTVVVLIGYNLMHVTMFHTLGSVSVMLIWAVLPLLATIMRQAAALTLGQIGLWSSPALLVGSNETVAMAQSMLQARPRPVFHVVRVVAGARLPENANTWRTLLADNRAESVVVAVQGHASEQPLLKSVQRSGVRFTKFIALPVSSAAPLETKTGRGGIGPVGHAVKASLDLVAALGLLIALAPLLILLAVLVKLDGGPALFRHERVGLRGRTFHCLKFRTMVVAADQVLQTLLDRDPVARLEWAETQKLRNDPRVTRIGQFLRATSLDELPQLLNVLNGEMSLVGPRPIVTAELPRYGAEVGYYLAITPGLTGLWQISGRSDTSYEQRVQLDIAYVRGWSFWRDLAILGQTVPAVVLKRGAV